ncbi:RNA-directed DNA polymerase from mobile element jockey-like [Brachionus plicatilis]|uniref:RNA-directed DNA polymerase from mobile element jockey-like n=1 Tax=Brachionus plicatilis TaxID=10195 RepID=A0A3M7PUG7_BRAPC|nr:RNA-directed DNA polymerase from mobile element jockey-like [Brachionus plicatilis]
MDVGQQLSTTKITNDYKNQLPPTIDSNDIKKIIKELPNGKSSGFGDTCSEMFKYGCIDELSIIIAKIIETMIKNNQFPYQFNVGKRLPIIKNNNGPNNEINYTRPITISDTIANLFEKYILHRLERKHSDPRTQFGFKVKSSTNHGIYTLTETIE